jgi:pyruvate formate lyase activating enzyme
VLAVAEQDAAFYARSGGGVTLSGGEPLWQKDFSLAILREAKRRHINASMETCGLVAWETLQESCRLLDSIFFDIKTLDAAKHQEQTNAPLAPILENFRKMTAEFPDLTIHVRTPIVPAFNDAKDDVLRMIELVRQYPNADLELLPYHRLGTQKYHFLGRECLMEDLTLSSDVWACL